MTQKCFCRKCQYGGDDEYFVNTREHGNSKQEEINAQHEVERTQDFPCSQKLCAEFHRSNESNSHQILFPVTWQDEGPARLGSVKLTRVDADASRATAMISAAAAAATQAVKLILQG